MPPSIESSREGTRGRLNARAASLFLAGAVAGYIADSIFTLSGDVTQVDSEKTSIPLVLSSPAPSKDMAQITIDDFLLPALESKLSSIVPLHMDGWGYDTDNKVIEEELRKVIDRQLEYELVKNLHPEISVKYRIEFSNIIVDGVQMKTIKILFDTSNALGERTLLQIDLLDQKDAPPARPEPRTVPTTHEKSKYCGVLQTRPSFV